MTSERVAEYLAACRRIQQMYHYDYVNQEIEALMQLPQWKIIYEQLGKDERRCVRGYLNYISDRSFGFLDTQIEAIEALTVRVGQLLQLELNARWLVYDVKSQLYWARIIEQPYWDKKSKAFLLTQSQAEMWVKRFCKLTSRWRFQAVKVDATHRLKRSRF